MFELIFILIILIVINIILYFVFGVNISKIKEAAKNEKLDKVVSLFPENKDICINILKHLKNNKVKIKQEDSTKTSLYIAVTDTILIGNIKQSYTRIQTIAHECLHSIQDRKLLIFNFVYSNIYLLYFIISIILTIFKVYTNYNLQILILTIMSFIYFIVRSYLEIDAMTKAKYLANDYMKEYIEENNICKNKDIDNVINKYEEINKIGIPATIFSLFFNSSLKIIIYILISIIMSIF